MEPQGRPLTPGTSYGPPSRNSAQSPVTATFPDCTLKSSCSPKVRDGLMPAKDSWDLAGEEELERTEGDQPGVDPESTQRRLRSSAFPSSLSWDSDSERETPDEEELQHFSNPHGLAAHSPGSPSSGLRLTSEDDQEPENLQLLHRRTDPASPVQGHDESTKTHISQLGPIEHSTVWNVSERAELLLANVKPKDGGQKDEEADNSEGEKRLEGEEATDPGRDVYSFPGDSDPESPPPAPWAHCTFIQRCRKKTVLLRPFSGLGTVKRTLPEPGKQTRVSPQKSKAAESAQLNEGGGVYKFEEANFGEVAVAESLMFRDRDGTREREEDTEVEPGREIFTCVECSIYFRKQVHLQEHIVEHCQSGAEGKGGGFLCDECGWNLPNGLALADHHRRHQESRRKILAEIEKLNENGKAREIRKPDSKMVKCVRSDLAFMQDTSKASVPDNESDPDTVAFPPASPAPLSGSDPAALHSDAATPREAGAPPQARGVSCRRRFICTKCNFSTRTSQALANHAKTHNRKKPAHHADPPPSGSPPRSAPTSLACGHCAFLTSSQTVMREHQRLVHPAGLSIGRAKADETGQRTRAPTGGQISDQSSASRPNKTAGKNKQGVPASVSSTVSDGPAAQTTSQVDLKRVGRMKRTAWTDDPKLSGSEEDERNGGRSTDCSQQEASSPAGVRRHTRARPHTGGCSAQQSTGASPPPKKSVSDRDKPEVEKDGKVFFLRRRNRVTAASAEIDSDDDDGDEDEDDDNIVEERVQRFLSEGILDEDDDTEDVGDTQG